MPRYGHGILATAFPQPFMGVGSASTAIVGAPPPPPPPPAIPVSGQSLREILVRARSTSSVCDLSLGSSSLSVMGDVQLPLTA